MNRFGLALVAFLFSVIVCNAQRFELGVDAGRSSYFGDLAPHSWKLGFSVGEPAIGINAGVMLNRYVTVRFGYMHGKIAGTDRNAIDSQARRIRNLSFESTINEASITAELNLISWTNLKLQDNLQPYVVLGMALFNFDPMVQYEGRMVRLQPLGTEGQGLSRFPDRSPYALNQISVPLGFGFKYFLNHNVWVGLSMKYRMTFTDYLDDVSLTYVNPIELAAFNGPLSAELAFRSDEVSDRQAVDYESSIRGNPAQKDWYLMSSISICYVFDQKKRKRRRKGCPRFRERKKMPRSYGL